MKRNRNIKKMVMGGLSGAAARTGKVSKKKNKKI